MEEPEQHKVVALASIYPVYDWLRKIGGERIDAHCLIPPGASPHTFNITPKQMRLVEKARVFFRIGRGLEIWADRVIMPAQPSLQVVTLSDGLLELHVKPTHLTAESIESSPTYPSTYTRQSPGLGADPHVWLDPILAKDMAKRIASTLSSHDLKGKSYYEQNLENYLIELESLDSEIRESVSKFSHKNFVAFHSAFFYFANRYGLSQTAVIEEFPGKEPTISYIKNLIDFLKKTPNPTVLAEPQLNDKIAQTIATESDATLVYVDPLGNPDDPERNTYLKLMHYNIGQLSNALK